MRKIKDLIYDYNDIFVALLIIAAAAAIIFWRVTDIMAYPEYLAGKEQSQTGEVDFSDVDLTPVDIEPFNENPDEITVDGNDVVALHFQVSGQRDILGTNLYRELHLRRDELCGYCVFLHFVQELGILGVDNGSFLLFNHFLGAARCKDQWQSQHGHLQEV